MSKANYRYRAEWLAYAKHFGGWSTMGYDMFARIMHQEEQSAFFQDMGRQAADLDIMNKKFRAEAVTA